ncbi:LysR family regulator CbbR [Brevirhabdus sp.]|uniref:LysR family regulator CbbR n=1 Tax=Brevirhabdus sp. TaxID=2004514 RepID=UPI004059C5F3
MPIQDAITFKQLRALTAVANHGSITAAAAQLGLTAPAVHTQLRGLEDNFQCQLLERLVGGGARLTPEGAELFEAFAGINARLATSIDRVRALQGGKNGVVVLGVVSTGKYFAPGLVASIRRTMPEIEILLRVGNRETIIEALQHSTIDLAIMGRPPRSPQVVPHVLGQHPHVLIAAADHPLAKRTQIGAREILAETFLAREEGSGTRIMMMRYLDRIGEGAPYRYTEMGTNETIKQAVLAGLGVALISQHTVAEELKSGRLVALPGEGLPIERKWYLLHRTDLNLTPVRANVVRRILEFDGSFLPSVTTGRTQEQITPGVWDAPRGSRGVRPAIRRETVRAGG